MSPASSLGGGSAAATPQSTAAMESVDTPLQQQEASDRLSGKPESSKNIAAVQGEQGQLGQDGQDSTPTPLTGDGQYCS